MQPYECHFGFRESPFNLTPDPRFFYPTPAYREAYATLRYGIEERKGFVLMSGEAGTGKTTLLRMLMQEMNSNIQAAFICNPPGTFTELLRMIINELELNELPSDRVAATAQFNNYLLEQLGKNRVVSVLVDEAQNLSEAMLEDLRLLSNFETHRSKLIQLVLIGQPELDLKLECPELRQLKQRIALRCSLKPLRPDDIARYIEFRIGVAGYQGRDLFHPGAVERLDDYTRGVPRLINVLCDNALLLACEREATQVTIDVIEEAARQLWLIDPRHSTGRYSQASATTTRAAGGALSSAMPVGGNEPNPSATERVTPIRNLLRSKLLAVALWTVVPGILVFAGANFYRAKDQDFPTLRGGDAAEQAGWAAKNLLSEEDPSAASGDSVDGNKAAMETSSPETQEPFRNGSERAAIKTGSNRVQRGGQISRDRQPVVSREREGTGHNLVSGSRDQALGVFNVVDRSFVRDKPSADAEITGALQPGTQVRVLGKTGEYFHVRAMGEQALSGYVHVEDAFFERGK